MLPWQQDLSAVSIVMNVHCCTDVLEICGHVTVVSQWWNCHFRKPYKSKILQFWGAEIFLWELCPETEQTRKKVPPVCPLDCCDDQIVGLSSQACGLTNYALTPNVLWPLTWFINTTRVCVCLVEIAYYHSSAINEVWPAYVHMLSCKRVAVPGHGPCSHWLNWIVQ